MAGSSKFTRPFSIGYAYAQTQHYQDTVAAERAARAAEVDPFDAIQDIPEAPAVEVPKAPAVDLATEAQITYALSLMERKLPGGMTPETRAAAEEKVRTSSRREVSKMIDTLKATPDAPKAPAPTPAPQVTEGMYRDPATGDIFKVQVAHHGSGSLYAKRLVKLEVPRVKRGKEYSHDFEYAQGAINRIQPSWKMSREEAAEWGRLYGACCKCGTILTDETSIAAGIGPKCAESF